MFEPRSSLWRAFIERFVSKPARQYQEQEKLIKDIGYIIVDGGLSEWLNYASHNTLFDIKKEKLFLYGLVRWRKSP